MTHDQHLDALDRRGEAAATALQDQAARRPRPAFDPDRPITLAPPAPAAARTLRRPVLAAAAVLVVLAGIAGAVALRSDDPVDDQAALTADGPRPFAATDLPDGYVLGGAADVGTPSDPGGEAGPVPVDLYGSRPDRPGLGVALAPDAPEWAPGATETVPLPDGRRAEVLETFGLAGTVLAIGVDERRVILVSQELDRAALTTVAAALTLEDGEPIVDPTSLPNGWSRLGTVPDLLGATSPLSSTAEGGGGPERIVFYVTEDLGGLAVAASAGDELRLDVMRLLMDDVRPITVRGHDGLVGTAATSDDQPDIRTVAWLEQPGELVRVSGYDLSEDELLAVAEGLEPLADEPWEDLLRRTRRGELTRVLGQPLELVGEGTFPDGTAWVLRALPTDLVGDQGTDDVGLAFFLDGPDLGSGTGGGESNLAEAGDSTGFRGFRTHQQAGRHVVFGDLDAAVAAVELRRPDGSVLAPAAVVEGGGVKAWVAELEEAEAVAIALDGSGAELDRIELTDYGRSATSTGQGSAIDPGQATTIPAGPGD